MPYFRPTQSMLEVSLKQQYFEIYLTFTKTKAVVLILFPIVEACDVFGKYK